MELLRALGVDDEDAEPLAHKWSRQTCDDASNPQPTWGLRSDALTALPAAAAVAEVQSRLRKIYPECTITSQPSDSMQRPLADAAQARAPSTSAELDGISAATAQPEHGRTEPNRVRHVACLPVAPHSYH